MYKEVFNFRCGKCGVVRKNNFGPTLLIGCRKTSVLASVVCARFHVGRDCCLLRVVEYRSAAADKVEGSAAAGRP